MQGFTPPWRDPDTGFILGDDRYCHWCGTFMCQDDHFHESQIIERLLHQRCISQLESRGLLPDHSELYDKRKHAVQLHYARKKAQVLRKVANDEAIMKVQKSGQLTIKALLAMTANELGWFEWVAKQVYLVNWKKLGSKKAFQLAIKQAEASEKKRKLYAVQHSWIRHGTIKGQ